MLAETVIVSTSNPTAPGETEEITVFPHEDGSYSLLATPGMLLGFAAGDIIRIDRGKVSIVQRSGCVGVHYFFPKSRMEKKKEIFSFVVSQAKQLGGWCDGFVNIRPTEVASGLVILTFPIGPGFRKIHSLMQDVCVRYPGSYWENANLSDAAGEPLKWWEVEELRKNPLVANPLFLICDHDIEFE